MATLIIGSTGLLGRALVAQWPQNAVVATSSVQLDIRDNSAVTALAGKLRPEWIILAAAYTDVDGCELNPELAFAVNARGAENVARATRDCGSRLMFISTDYVFDGSASSPYEETARKSSICVYGASKSAGEDRILQVLPEACIVRTSWLFGIAGKCFPNTILSLAATREEIQVVHDQRGSPTWNRDLARAISELIRRNASGIYHVTNSGDCTWFEFARAILGGHGYRTIVHPISTDDSKRPARRPRYSVLSHKKLNELGIYMPHWREALAAYSSQLSPAQAVAVGGR